MIFRAEKKLNQLKEDKEDLVVKLHISREKVSKLILTLNPEQLQDLSQFVEYGRLISSANELHDIDVKIRTIEFLIGEE